MLAIVNAAGEWSRFAPGSLESEMLTAAGEHLGVPLRPRPLQHANGNRLEVEGVDQDGRIVVQLVANRGSYKPSYRNKVLANLFKLVWLRAGLPTAERAVLVVTELITQALGGWVAVAADDLGIEVLVFDGQRAVPMVPDGRGSNVRPGN